MVSAAATTRQKALSLNLDGTTYGTFAEIGAGQEVARWFFSVGGAAGTIAKTISAYDMLEQEFGAITGGAGGGAWRRQAILRLRRHRGDAQLPEPGQWTTGS